MDGDTDENGEGEPPSTPPTNAAAAFDQKTTPKLLQSSKSEALIASASPSPAPAAGTTAGSSTAASSAGSDGSGSGAGAAAGAGADAGSGASSKPTPEVPAHEGPSFFQAAAYTVLETYRRYLSTKAWVAVSAIAVLAIIAVIVTVVDHFYSEVSWSYHS